VIRTFFHGVTLDGDRWVLVFEGGPTATDPSARCIVDGLTPTFYGRQTLRGLSVAQGSHLRALLPVSYTREVASLILETRNATE
jgi:hypothetical protein